MAAREEAHGGQPGRHSKWMGEMASTAQRCDSHAQPFCQHFLAPLPDVGCLFLPEARRAD